MRRLALTLVVVAVVTIGLPIVAFAAPPASTPNTTYSIHGTAATTPVVTGSCPVPLPPGPDPVVVPITITVTGAAVVSRLGAVTVVVDETGLGVCFGAPVPAPIQVLTAEATFTARNGDTLVTETVRSSPIEQVPNTPYFAFTAFDEIIGGSGRMAGATGQVRTSVTFDPTATPIAATFTMSGTVTLPKA